ncbi:MAG: C25 family cysteine peptidase [Planctomycetota bacterium]
MSQVFSSGGRLRDQLILTLLLAIVLPGSALAQDASSPVQSFTDGQIHEVRYTATFTPEDLIFDQLLGYDRVQLADGLWLDTPGEPMLPVQRLYIALPAGMSVTKVSCASFETLALPGAYNIFPTQPPRHVSTPATPADFVAPDPDTYQSTEAFPAQPVQLIHQSDLAGQGMALLQIAPLRYFPAEHRLELYTSIEVVLEGTGGYVCGDYLPDTISASGRAACENALANLVINPEHVAPRVSDQPRPLTRGVPAGTYDYVIITQTSWVDDFQPLADWKTKRGVPATIVTTDWIYNSGGYSGTNYEKIRAFVIDAYSNWGTIYFLLGGDTNTVPYQIKNVLDDDIPNDTYYGDFDDDLTCEVHVGRASTRDTSAISTFINKVFTYEQNPPMTDYVEIATMLGFDLNEYGSGEGEGCKEVIRTILIPDDWTCRTEYDSESGSHLADSLNYLNQGNNLVNHIDHSSTNVMGAGGTVHGDYMNRTDMSNLTNGDRQSIYYSIGCWACDYAADTCIAESFVRNANGGGIAFIGNSRYGWYQPYQTDGVSLRYDRIFFASIFASRQYNLGAAFSFHKNVCSGQGYYDYIFTELTLLGDPELPIWTSTPQDLSIAHAETLTTGVYSTFPVQVNRGTGIDPIEGATVCLWKDDDVYEVATTNEAGLATFSFVPTSTGTMLVTVSAHDYLTYEGNADVQDGTTYTLTVNTTGQGSVTLDPPGGTYAPGTWVELTAEGADGWTFDHWGDALTGAENPTDILMDNDYSVTAVFVDFEDCNENGVPDDQDISSGTSTDFNGNGIPDECDGLGDMNCDGEVNAYDIDGFICALSVECDYEGQYPGCDRNRGDCNGDGEINAYDIDNFILIVGS